jgi:outer membrane protein assembly factor BamB
MAQRGDRVYFATYDMKLYCLDVKVGSLKWELLTGLNIREAPRVIGEHLFVHPEHHGMYCLNASNGRQVWWNPKVAGILAATPDVVYASDDFGSLIVLRLSDGQQLGSVALSAFPRRVANDRTDRIYLASETGLVVSLRETQRDFPLFHRNPEQRPILPDLAPEKEENPPDASAKPAGDTETPESPKDGAAAKSPTKKTDSEDAAPATEDSEKPAPPAKRPAKKPIKKPAEDQ